jgi:hypothetical protein
MNEMVEKIARAVLYEGYMLYPYRTSALKNRQRWNFGVLFPETYSAVWAGAERSSVQAECLILGSAKTFIHVSVRFLHLISEIRAENGEPFSNTESAMEREASGPETNVGRLTAESISMPFQFGPAPDLAHRQETVDGLLEINAVCLRDGVFKLTASARNVTAVPEGDLNRYSALMRSLISTHIILRVIDGEFVSLMDPSVEHREAAESCRNLGVWPVLVGEGGRRDCMLASPIILYDYPQVAPESAGDFFDGTEIDELLTLRILTLTDEEKKQMRDGDPQAREILERSEALPADHLMKLHGALRGTREIKRED